MDTESPPDIFLFEEFRFDRRGNGLTRYAADGELQPVSLGSRALAILGVLVERSGELVPKDDIMRIVWPGTMVEEANLTVQISALRRALDKERTHGSCIQTIPGRGYRFVVRVRHLDDVPNSLVPPQINSNSGNGPLLAQASEDDVTAPDSSTPQRFVRRRWRIPFVLSLIGVSVATTIMLLSAKVPDLWFHVQPTRPRLSLVVLPFENLGGDPKDDYLADGITDDLTTDLSILPEVFVIARESAYTYKGKPADVRKIGEELGVRYVLEGSVRRIENTLRVNVRLTSAETGGHLWSDRFDEQISELAAGQEQIVIRLRSELGVSLVEIEKARGLRERPTNPDAFDLILRARSLGLHPMGPREHENRRALLEQVLRLDPHSIFAMTRLANEVDAAQNWGSTNDGERERAAKLIADAAAINPNDPNVLEATGNLLFNSNQYGEAIWTFQRLLSEYPNYYSVYNQLGYCLIIMGRAQEAIPLLETAMRRDPRSASNWDRYGALGWAMLALGRDQESITWNRRALAANPNAYPGIIAQFHIKIAVAYARLGRIEDAHGALAEANRIWPYDTVRSHWPVDPSNRLLSERIERFQAELRQVGLRDHATEDADFGVPADGKLRLDYAGLTPTTVPGARTIGTSELEQLINENKPIVIDPLLYSWGRSIPGAVGLKNAGHGGSASDAMQDRLGRKIHDLAKGNFAAPIVAVGWNSERFDGRNLALRLVALGYTNVYWYRGGREAWEVAGLPEAGVNVQEW
jgi:adenylate cyclase